LPEKKLSPLKRLIFSITILICVGTLVLMAKLIYEQSVHYSKNFHVSLNQQSGEPQIQGKISRDYKLIDKNSETFSLVIEIPELETLKIQQLLSQITPETSLMNEWIYYQADLPKEENFQWCQSSLQSEGFEWIKKKPSPNSRFIFTNPSLGKKNEFNFVLFDLNEKKIFRCFGSF
jgi:hypothetical protein